jgi:hypothetical protein
MFNNITFIARLLVVVVSPLWHSLAPRLAV